METPYWLTDAEIALPARQLDGPPEVEIVGAGITGCACALALARAGRRVRVLDERSHVAEGASGRNGGFALGGGAARYDVARESYGAEQALLLWRRTEEALDRLGELAGDALRREGSLRLAADEEERDDIRKEFDALREDGVDAEWRDRGDLPEHLRGSFHGAIFHPADAAVQPARLVRRLAAAAAEAGAEFRLGKRLERLDDREAPEIVLATDGYGRGLVPELDERIWPARGQVVATEPLEERLFPIPHYARQGFDYWQQLEDGRLVAGGFRDFSIMSELTNVEETTPVIQDALTSFIRDLLGRDPEITHRWAGIFGLTQDLLPLVGRVPGYDGVWVAAGYSGHGNVLGFLSGGLVARALLGEGDPLLELFDPARLF
jgi:glycine/D-amino acid oxidase-like deaminating enzyme